MDLSREDLRDVHKLAGVIAAVLWSLVEEDPDLRSWYHYHVVEWDADYSLASRLLRSARTPEELEKEVGEILGALPRYLELVKKVMEVEELHSHRVLGLVEKVFWVFKALAPLSSEPRMTGLRFRGHPILVDGWIKVHDGRPFSIDTYGLSALRLVVSNAEEIAKYVEDEEKRKVFLRLAEAAGRLNLGEWESSECAAGACVRIDYDAPRYVFIDGKNVSVINPEYLPDLAQHLGTLERLYDSILDALKNAEHNERILEEMKKIAAPYVVDAILG